MPSKRDLLGRRGDDEQEPAFYWVKPAALALGHSPPPQNHFPCRSQHVLRLVLLSVV